MKRNGVPRSDRIRLQRGFCPESRRFKPMIELWPFTNSRAALFRLPRNHTGVYSFSRSRDNLKKQFVTGDLNQGEGAVRVESFHHLGRRAEIMEAQFSRVSEDKVVNAVLRRNPFVDMF